MPFINWAALHSTSYQHLESWSDPSITCLSETLNLNRDWEIYCFLLLCIPNQSTSTTCESWNQDGSGSYLYCLLPFSHKHFPVFPQYGYNAPPSPGLILSTPDWADVLKSQRIFPTVTTISQGKVALWKPRIFLYFWCNMMHRHNKVGQAAPKRSPTLETIKNSVLRDSLSQTVVCQNCSYSLKVGQ